VRPVRIAGHTYPYRDRPLGDALDELARLRLSLVEVWLGHAHGEPDSVASALRERGLEAAAVSAGGFYAADSDLPARAFELAQAVGAPVVVACVNPELLDSIVERVPVGVTLCVENHWDQRLATSRDVIGVLAAYPGLASCVDTGHAILAGEAPERFVVSLGPGVGHVHLKDAALPPLHERIMGRRLRTRLLPKPQPVLPGEGALDVARMRGALQNAGYAGTVAVEYEGPEPSVALDRLLNEWTSSSPSTV
jgi:sugar phosphate isomerase/epimerase